MDSVNEKVVIDSLAWIPKQGLSLLQQETIKNRLSIKPIKFAQYDKGDDNQPIKLFVETETHIGVPPSFYFSVNTLFKPEWQASEGDKTSWPGDHKFYGILRDEQQRAINETIQVFKTMPGGIVQAVPGFGKTVTACALMATLNVPTLVVVHKEFLLKQWKERIAQFLPNAQVGEARQDTCDFVGKHIVIGLVQSLASRDYGPLFKSWPGLIIVDECHRVSARTWSAVPLKYPCRWRLGLSATPRRKDGTADVFKYSIGPIIFVSKEVRLAPKIKRIFTDFDLHAYKSANLSFLTDNMVLKFLCSSKARNSLIVENLRKALETGRKVIVLSKRIEHLKKLQRELQESYVLNPKTETPTTGLFIGGLSEEEQDSAAKCQCIFATFQLVAEALDIPALDTLFLVTPASDIEQAAGRILRPFEGKKDPVIVDFRDDKVQKLYSSGISREKQYKKFGWME